MRFQRKCTCCQSSYSYCPDCSDFKDKPRWMFLFCSQNCHDIYTTMNDFYTGKTTKDQAKKRFQALDLSGYSNFMPLYKKEITKFKQDIEAD